MSEMFVVRAGARSGKTTRLLAHALEAAERTRVLVLGIGSNSTANLRSLLSADAARAVTVAEIGEFAGDIARFADPALRCIDEASAYRLYERAAEELFAGTWPPAEARIDVEVAELRSPERFLEHAQHLIERLRRAAIAPREVVERAAKGAAAFYAHPPNLGSPSLLAYLNDTARGSLEVDTAELLRQHRREIDLAKIVAELYARFEASLENEHLADRCAVFSLATAWLRSNPAPEQRAAFAFDAVFVDDAEHCDERMHDFLAALTLDESARLILTCDDDGAHRPMQGARIERLAEAESEHLTAIVRSEVRPTVERAPDREREAQRVAAWIDERIAAGTPAQECAILLRDLDDGARFEQALHERNIATARAGRCNLFRMPEILDAFALLCWVADPYANDALLRLLESPRLALADASIALLCGKAASDQRSLFIDAERTNDDPRPKALRLGDNVLSGAVDPLLGEVARERVAWLRAFHARSREFVTHAPLLEAIDRIWAEGLAPSVPESAAHERSRTIHLEAFRARIADCDAGDGIAALFSLCEHLHDVAERERTEIAYRRREGIVTIAAIEAAVGISFDSVAVPGLQAGAFPAYYVPPAFLFTPSYGLAARDNAGGEKSSRAAKHAYMNYRYKLRERHIEQERRLFAFARSRANAALLLTASGRPTRGVNTPEFLEEFRR